MKLFGAKGDGTADDSGNSGRYRRCFQLGRGSSEHLNAGFRHIASHRPCDAINAPCGFSARAPRVQDLHLDWRLMVAGGDETAPGYGSELQRLAHRLTSSARV